MTRQLAGWLAGWLAAGALAAGCADDPPTAAVAAPRPARAAPVVTAPPRADVAAAPGTLVLRRTTSAGRGAQPRARADRHETWKIPEAALVRRAGVVSLPAPTARDLAQDRIAELRPIAVLQLPAMAASAVCANAPAWQRESRVGALTVVTRGRGDEPWSTVEAWVDGRLVSRSRSVWERRRASWRLVSQEDVAVGTGAMRTLAVDQAGLRRAAGDVEVPRVTCADPKTGVVPAARAGAAAGTAWSPAWTAGLGPAGLAGMELAGAVQFAAEETCTATEEEVAVACASKLLKMIAAGAGSAIAASAMWTMCVVPQPFEPIACAVAFAAYTAAAATFEENRLAYVECTAEASAPKPCGCPATDALMASAPLVGVAHAATAAGTSRPATAPLALDCTEPPPPTDDGGGGGGGETGDGGGGTGGGGSWVEICVYTEHYDAEGNYLGVDFEGCHFEWME